MSEVTVLADALAQGLLDRVPTSASVLGISGYGDRLPDYGEVVSGIPERLAPVGLSGTVRVTRVVVVQQGRVLLEQVEGRWAEFTVSDLILTLVPGLLLTLTTLRGLPAFFATLAQRHCVADGRTARLTATASAPCSSNRGLAEKRNSVFQAAQSAIPAGCAPRPEDRRPAHTTLVPPVSSSTPSMTGPCARLRQAADGCYARAAPSVGWQVWTAGAAWPTTQSTLHSAVTWHSPGHWPRSTRPLRPPATTRRWTACCSGCTPIPPAVAAARSRSGRKTSIRTNAQWRRCRPRDSWRTTRLGLCDQE